MNSSLTDFPDRDVRQRGLIPPDRLAACHAVVIGVGAIGRQVALQLAAVGMPLLILYDHDSVAVENLAAQGYRPDQLTSAKVDATADDCRRLHPYIHVLPRAERFRRSTSRQVTVGGSSLVVFCCVDSIETRRLVWEAVRHQSTVFLDGRMSAEVMRVLTVESPATDGYYASTLFGAEEAYAGACTARSTIYTASIAAGLMVGQMTKWLRRLPVDPEVTLNLLSMELSVTASTWATGQPTDDNLISPGSLYARALVPWYAVDDWRNNRYSAWYIAHRLPAALEQAALDPLWQNFCTSDSVSTGPDAMENFAGFLDRAGYTVMHSHAEGTLIVDAA